MLERRVRVTNEFGLHARAAAKLVRAAQRFSSTITLSSENRSVMADARSILDILHFAAARGVDVTITADGKDEEEAVAAVAEMFLDGFGELND